MSGCGTSPEVARASGIEAVSDTAYKLLETRVTAQSTPVLDAALFQGLQRVVVGEARIDSHPDTGMARQGQTAVGCIDFVSGLLESEGMHEPRALNG